MNFFRQNRASLMYTALMGVMPLLVSSSLTLVAIRYEPLIRQFSASQWLFAYAVACLTMAFALTPTTFVALVSGYFLGWRSVPLLVISYLIAAWLGYRAARYVDRGKLIQSISRQPRARDAVDRLRSGELGIIVLSRISPVLPFAIMNAVLSALGVNVSKFMWGSLVGMLPRTLVAVWVGTQVGEIRSLFAQPGENNLLRIVFIGLLLISIIGFYAYFRRILRSR